MTSDLENDEPTAAAAETWANDDTGLPLGDEAIAAERRRLICAVRCASLVDDHREAGCLAGIATDLMEFQAMLADALRSALRESGDPLDAFEDHDRSVQTMIKLTKQIASMKQLEYRARKQGSGADRSRLAALERLLGEEAEKPSPTPMEGPDRRH